MFLTRLSALSLAAALTMPALAQDAPAADTSAQIQQLREEVQALRVRLAQLELQLSKANIVVPSDTTGPADQDNRPVADGSAASSSKNWGQVKQLKLIEPEVSQEQQSELEALQQDIEQQTQALGEARADMVEAGSADLDGVNRGGGYRYDNDAQAANVEAQRELREADTRQRAERREVSTQRDQLNEKKRQLVEARAAAEPRQELIVSRDNVEITLVFESGSAALNGFDPQWQYVSWTGQILESDGQSQRWKAQTLSPLTAEQVKQLRDDNPSTDLDADGA